MRKIRFGKRGENPRYGQTERRMQWDIFKKSGGDTAPVCDGIYVSERPDRQERNLLARHRNYCTRLRTVAQHGKEGVEGSGGKGIFEEGNPSQGKWGVYFKPLYHFVI